MNDHKEGKFIREYEAISDAQRKLGILKTSIVNALSGKSKLAGGFIWKYAHYHG